MDSPGSTVWGTRRIPGRIVLEIGTGALAPLARLCAEHGARRVYAVEVAPAFAAMARAGIQRDGLDDVVRVVEGLSTQVRLPERAEVLVHEIVGIMGCDEGMARAVADAKERLLLPGARILPAVTQVQVAPVRPLGIRNPWTLTMVERLARRSHAANRRHHVWNLPRERLLAAPQVFEHKAFEGDFALAEAREIRFRVERAAPFLGFAFWNRIELEPDNAIDCFRGTSWPVVVFAFPEQPFELRAGDTLQLATRTDLRRFPTYRMHAAVERDGRVLEVWQRELGAAET